MLRHISFWLGCLWACCELPVDAARADDGHKRAVMSLNGVWAIQVGFGEIPFLAGSFKPSVSLGYHFNEYLYIGYTAQFRDVLERGTESFNAVDTGLGGVERTREETGVRSLLAVRARPHRYSPYLALGLLFNGSDREVMHFDSRERTIGAQNYEGMVVLEQTRPWAIRPAVGLGYSYTFDEGFSLGVEMAGAFFLPAPTPELAVGGEALLSQADEAALKSRISKKFKDNFHNRYHLFQMTAGYVW